MRWGTIQSTSGGGSLPCVCGLRAARGETDARGAGPVPWAWPNSGANRRDPGRHREHIEAQVRLGGGYFKLPFRNQELRLKLVRVHTEYLSKLGPLCYFACVDLADISGDVYDVDFFLAGDPVRRWKVTETTVHKLNGQPFYAWEQKSNGTWHRIPLKEASEGHLGVIRGRGAEFEFFYRNYSARDNRHRPHVSAAGHGLIPDG